MRVHLFPSRTQKLSSCTPTILGGRLPGKIGNANTKTSTVMWRFFHWNRRTDRSTCFLLRCPAYSLPTERHRHLPTAAHAYVPLNLPLAARSNATIPTQKLSSCAPTILGLSRKMVMPTYYRPPPICWSFYSVIAFLDRYICICYIVIE